MPGFPFVETRCAIGGCACPQWGEWHQARRDFAQAHPRAKALEGIADDNAYSEAVDDLAEELDGEFTHLAGACGTQGCRHARGEGLIVTRPATAR